MSLKVSYLKYQELMSPCDPLLGPNDSVGVANESVAWCQVENDIPEVTSVWK